jgi:hypothetical protein
VRWRHDFLVPQLPKDAKLSEGMRLVIAIVGTTVAHERGQRDLTIREQVSGKEDANSPTSLGPCGVSCNRAINVSEVAAKLSLSLSHC